MTMLQPSFEPIPQSCVAPSSNLFERLGRGEADAYDEFVERYGKWVACVVRRSLGPFSQDFDDAMQDAMLALVRAAPRFNRALGAETTYIAAVVRNEMIARSRKANRRIVSLSHDPAEFDESRTAASSRHDVDHGLQRALGRLEPRQRTFVELSVIAGQTHAQIAQATGVCRETVRRLINSALAQMRDDLREQMAAA